jgi:hypothetical protein
VVERGGELAVDARLLVLWAVVADVAALVRHAPLDERGVAEHLAHRGGECFGAVDHDQQPAVGIEALAYSSGSNT